MMAGQPDKGAYDQVIVDLADAIQDRIDTYVQGHDIPVAAVVGVLHMLAFDLICDAKEAAEEGGEDREEEGGD